MNCTEHTLIVFLSGKQDYLTKLLRRASEIVTTEKVRGTQALKSIHKVALGKWLPLSESIFLFH